MSEFSLGDLPPVSSAYAFTLLVVYLFRGILGVLHENVHVSWETVIRDRQLSRLFYAQFFHFAKLPVFLNFTTILALGRHLEKKMYREAYAILIYGLSVVSNVVVIFISNVICPEAETHTAGFTMVTFALRFVYIFTMDSNANDGKGDPSLVFGFLPVYLPPAITPWLPILEVTIFEAFIMDICLAGNVSGMITGLLFPIILESYGHLIMLPRNPPPPPNPGRRNG